LTPLRQELPGSDVNRRTRLDRGGACDFGNILSCFVRPDKEVAVKSSGRAVIRRKFSTSA
jgi:hypothetical protein